MTASQVATIARTDSSASRGIYRYSSLGTAINASYHAATMLMIVMGDDDTFWVMCPAFAQKLERAGYELAQ